MADKEDKVFAFPIVRIYKMGKMEKVLGKGYKWILYNIYTVFERYTVSTVRYTVMGVRYPLPNRAKTESAWLVGAPR